MKTTIKLFAIALLSAFSLQACKDKPKEKNTETVTVENVDNSSDDIVTTTLTSKDGKTLEMTFNNTEGTATVNLDGETTVLDQQRAASGIWYKNDQYELRGKGNDIQLTKDGNVIFEHQDDKVNVEAKNNKSDVLTLTFNNTQGTVKAYLNGGEQIDLTEKKTASGIWYNNDNYELKGKGDRYTLKKDGEIVFQN